MNARENQFESEFAQIYGERWPALRAALLTDPQKTVLKNPFGGELQDYSLDPASLFPPRWLEVTPGLRVADLCASPGGKSLSMIFGAMGEGEWHLNDLSPGRVARLKGVLHDCLPPAVLGRVRVSRGDASRWGMQYPARFDRVLVDAPCSGERHLLASPSELARWSLKGVKRLVVRQHALLCAALDSLAPGGRLVYSTCAIHPLENDGVVTKLTKSRAGQFSVVPVKEVIGEPTEHGWILLPDRAGCGPIYFSVLTKN